MKTRRRDLEIFSLSFLDCICCGFGAIILLFVLSKFAEPIIIEEVREDLQSVIIRLEEEIFEIRGETQVLNRELEGKIEQLSIEKVRRVIEVARRRKAISLGTAFGEGDSELVDLVTDEDTACPEDEFVQRRVVEQTRRLLATLTPREEEILRKCFGIGRRDHIPSKR